MQSKKESGIEVAFNIGTGFIISWALTLYLLPLYQTDQLTKYDGFEITMIYTIVSVIRSYTWRRFFNKQEIKV